MDKLEKGLSAAEARALTETSPVFLKRLYKVIKESATEGICLLNWGLYGADKTCLDTAVTTLRNDGYDVKIVEDAIDPNSLSLEIKW